MHDFTLGHVYVIFLPPPQCDSTIWFLSSICVQSCINHVYAELLSSHYVPYVL